MSESLSDLLRHTADEVPGPRVDVGEVVARAGVRQRRRRLAGGAAAAALVGAVVVGSFVVRSDSSEQLEPAPSPSPTPSPPSSVAVDPAGTRPLVYADGSTVHVGDETVEAEKPVAFIDATDDGAVFEATLDHTLWFTDGTTTRAIGTTPFTAAPTFHGGVWTGDSGSLVVWGDLTGRLHRLPVELVVFDTSRLQEVGRIPVPEGYTLVLYVDDDQVFYSPDSTTPGCWVYDVQRCNDPHLFRYDVTSGETTEIRLAELDAELSRHARMFVAHIEELQSVNDFHQGALFTPDGRRLAHAYPSVLTRTDGEVVRLRLPSGWTDPQPDPQTSGGMIRVAQWLDDDTVVVWADNGGGDLPAKDGDVLVCPLPNGVCRVEVARGSPRGYVLPVRAFY
jgi:hypothetical protein